MWYNLSLEDKISHPGSLYKLGVYTKKVTVSDTMIFPEGYHPASASPVDSLYILWFLSGKKRSFISKADDNYSWVKNCENLFKS